MFVSLVILLFLPVAFLIPGAQYVGGYQPMLVVFQYFPNYSNNFEAFFVTSILGIFWLILYIPTRFVIVVISRFLK